MQFKIRRRTAHIVQKKKRRFVLKGTNTLRKIKKRLPVRNYSADDFGAFDESEKRSARRPSRIAAYIKALASRRKGKAPRVSVARLGGILCAAVLITLISGGAVLLSIFARYGGAYTEIIIPDLTSLSEADALAVSSEYFDYTVSYQSNPEKSPGQVISQSPLPGVRRKLYGRNDKIRVMITVNKAPDSITLPELVGAKARETVLKLKNSGLRVRLIEEYSETVASGKIFFSSLRQGSVVKAGDVITIRASLGPKTKYFQVPDLTGLGENEAISLLTAKGLAVGRIEYKSSAMPLGTVISQDKTADTSLPEGSKVSLVISGGLYH